MERSSGEQVRIQKIAARIPPPTVWRHLTGNYVSTTIALLAIIISVVTWGCYVEDLEVAGAWGCEMSWISPWYQALEWSDAPSSRYTVYLYREQGWDTEALLNGHPVLFIPGNAGSYQQVRSIASSASRQYYREPEQIARDMNDLQKLDFFTLDLQEDFSAFHARTLDNQATFIRQSILMVLREYEHLAAEQRPRQVTLLAHSMGGIAARLAVDPTTSALVDIIVTMSTPHTIPPVTLERRMDKIYDIIDTMYHNGTTPPLISLCGGISDSQVVSESCALPLRRGEISSRDIAVFTTGLPGAWTGVDHQAMVWCHQIRWRVARMLLAITQTEDISQKMQKASSWLLAHEQNDATTDTPDVQQSVPIVAKDMSLFWSSSTKHVQIQQCNDIGSCIPIASTSELLPWPKQPLAPFPLPGEGIKTDEVMRKMEVHLDDDRGFLLTNSTDGDLIASGQSHNDVVHGRIWTRDSNLPFASHQILDFPSVTATSLNVYRLAVRTPDCQGRHPLIRSSFPTNSAFAHTTFESRFHVVDPATFIRVHSHVSAAPFAPISPGPRGLKLELFQLPDCPIEQVEVVTDYAGVMAKTVTRYRMTAIAWPASWVALALLLQSRRLESKGEMLSFGAALEQVGKHWFLPCTGALYSIFAVQHLFLASPRASLFLVGTSQWALAPLVGVFALWAFGAVAILWFILHRGMLPVVRACLLRIQTSSTYGSTARTGPSDLRLLPLVGPIYWCLPHQLVYVVAFAVLLVISATSPALNSEGNFTATVLVFMTVRLPFRAPGLFVWIRTMWGSWPYFPDIERNLLHVASAFSVVILCGQDSAPKRSLPALRAYQASLIVFCVSAFVVGSRYTWVLDVLGDVVLFSIAAVLQ